MQPLNPFLRAFFSSKLPSQCKPASNYILFFPSTEHLLTYKEYETQSDWTDLVSSEEIIASHVVRVPNTHGPIANGKDGPSLRDGKGKAKQFPTLNGRTVVIKDNFIYSNKGFKTLNQAQLVQDVIYYPDQADAQQWLVIFISKPLVGTPQPIHQPSPQPDAPAIPADPLPASPKARLDIKGFNDLLNHFPIIARQMQPGLEKLFQQFMASLSEDDSKSSASKESPTSKDFPRPPNRRSIGSLSSVTTLDGAQSHRSSIASAGPAESSMRSSLETLVWGAIALFQGVDKHQLSLLSSSTDLSNLALEHMIERYVTEHFHTRVLFPRVKAARLSEDEGLEASIKHMADLDICQVGAVISGGQPERRELNLRLVKGVEAFKRMAPASSPQEMADVLLETARSITTATDASPDKSEAGPEKSSAVILSNADLLVSLLLVVVVRSPIRHLHARLAYMAGFVFTDEVETGEIGYALSTFEAVLSYLSSHPSGLKRASQAIKSLRRDARKGNLAGVRSALEQDGAHVDDDNAAVEDDSALPQLRETVVNWMNSNGVVTDDAKVATTPPKSPDKADASSGTGLAHVFPFQRTPSDANESRPKLKKRVSISADVHSRSSSSAHSAISTTHSALSRSSTLRTNMSYNVKDETSPERLCSCQDSSGDSLLMTAIGASQSRVLDYLLDRSDMFPFDSVLDDCNNAGATLLNTAMSIGDQTVIDILIDYLAGQCNKATMQQYLSRQDATGRSAAHYLFNAPHLISRLAPVLPWDLRDKNGQTPLFTLCRSYDHDNYINMVEVALHAAREKQGDNEPLHLDMHTDAKMNTLLHIANDHRLILTLLRECDADPNIKNDKSFTPLMVASKFARLESVRLLFHDTRTDLLMRDARGFTAVELAKDDDVRNRIDDLVLLTHAPGADGRVTMIVRSYFVEDGTIRMILKSGASNTKDTIMVTTCRRSLGDFETLTKWLAQEHPASWIPSVSTFRSPFQLPFRPSRVVLRDTQLRLDIFLKTMLSHPSFAHHEMVWEFFLVPEIDPELLSQRAQLKASTRVENLRHEHSAIPLDAVSSVELFIDHATDQIHAVHYATQDVLRHVNAMRNVSFDLSSAQNVMLGRIAAIPFIPPVHLTAMKRHAHAVTTMNFAAESSPMTSLHYGMLSTLSTTTALLAALARPRAIIARMRTTAEQISRHEQSAARSAKWPSALGLLDDARRRLLDDSVGKAERAAATLETLGHELSYTQATVAAELAGWWEMRAGSSPARKAATTAAGAAPPPDPSATHDVRRTEGSLKAGLRAFARGMIVRERERLERLRRAGRLVGVDVFRPRRPGASIGSAAELHADVPPPLPTPLPGAAGIDASAHAVDEADDLYDEDEEAPEDIVAGADEVDAALQTSADDQSEGHGTTGLADEPAPDDEPELTEAEGEQG